MAKAKGIPFFLVIGSAVCIASAAPLLAVWAWSHSALLNAEYNRVNEQHLLIAKQISGDLDQYHRQVNAAFEAYAPHLAVKVGPTYAEELFTSYGFRHICVFHIETAELSFGFLEDDATCPGRLPPDRLAFLEETVPAASRDVVLTGVHKFPNLPPLMYILSRQGDKLVVGAVTTEHFKSIQDDVGFGENAHVAIFDRSGRILAHPNASWEDSAKDISALSIVQSAQNASAGVAQFFSPEFETEMIAGFSVVPEAGWVVMVPQPTRELHNAASSVFSNSIMILVFGLAGGLVMSIAVSLPMIRTIKKTVKVTTEFSQCNPDVRIKRTRETLPIEELARLENTFNSMADRIQKSHKTERELRRNAEKNASAAMRLAIVEKDLREHEQQSAEARKLEAIGRLTAGVAHDFNNILAVIVGNAEFLKADPDDRDRQEFIDQILTAAHRAAALNRKMLAFGRRARLSPKSTDVQSLIERAARMVHSTLPANIQLVIGCLSGPRYVHVDEDMLQTALMNLVMNARDALPNGGRIEFVCREIQLAEGSKDRLALGIPAGNYVAIAVSDSGSGMGQTELDAAFDPFFTTKDAGKGTGLGLSMVQGFAAQSGGTTKIESEVGSGTTVTIILPVSSASHSCESPPISMQRVLPAHLVLLVEDQKEVLGVFQKILENAGHTVLTATSGEMGQLELESGRKPDILLTDVFMPGEVDGIELARRARKRFPDLGIVLISGYPNSAGLGTLAEISNAVILQKPVNAIDLLNAMENSLGGLQTDETTSQ